MTTQPEALRLAEWMEWNDASMEIQNKAAAELRRLHKVNTELLDALRLSADHAHWRDIEAQIRAAINKAEGEAK